MQYIVSNSVPSIKSLFTVLGATIINNNQYILKLGNIEYNLHDYIPMIYGESFIAVKSKNTNPPSKENKRISVFNHDSGGGTLGTYRSAYEQIKAENSDFVENVRKQVNIFLEENVKLNDRDDIKEEIQKEFNKWFTQFNFTHSLKLENWNLQHYKDAFFILSLASIVTPELEVFKTIFSKKQLNILTPSFVEKLNSNASSIEQEILNNYYKKLIDIYTEFDVNSFDFPKLTSGRLQLRPIEETNKIVLQGGHTETTHLMIYLVLSCLDSLKGNISLERMNVIEKSFTKIQFKNKLLPIYIDVSKLPYKYFSGYSKHNKLSLKDLWKSTIDLPDVNIDILLEKYVNKLIFLDNVDLLKDISFLAENPFSSSSIMLSGYGFHKGVKSFLVKYGFSVKMLEHKQNNDFSNYGYILSQLYMSPQYRKAIDLGWKNHNRVHTIIETIVNKVYFEKIEDRYNLTKHSLYQIFAHLLSYNCVIREDVSNVLSDAFCNLNVDESLRDMLLDTDAAKTFIDYSNLFYIPRTYDDEHDYAYLPMNNIISSFIISKNIITKTRDNNYKKMLASYDYSHFSMILLELSKVESNSLKLYILYFLIGYIDKEEIEINLLSKFLSSLFVEYIVSKKGKIFPEFDDSDMISELFFVLREKRAINIENVNCFKGAFTAFLSKENEKKLIQFELKSQGEIFVNQPHDIFSFLSSSKNKVLYLYFDNGNKESLDAYIQCRLYLLFFGIYMALSENLKIHYQKKDYANVKKHIPSIMKFSPIEIEENTEISSDNALLIAEVTINIFSPTS